MGRSSEVIHPKITHGPRRWGSECRALRACCEIKCANGTV